VSLNDRLAFVYYLKTTLVWKNESWNRIIEITTIFNLEFTVLIEEMFSKVKLVILFLQILSVAGEKFLQRTLQKEPKNNDELEISATLKVKAKHVYGKNINVSFENPNPQVGAYAFIGIFEDTGGSLPLNAIPDWSLFTAWLHDCYTQEDCAEPVKQGSVVFSAKDPKSYYYSDYYGYGYGYFPFRNGKYMVCFINETYDSDDDGAVGYYDLITNCKRFLVKKPADKIKQTAKIKPINANIKQKEPFEAKFKTPTPIRNQWVGVYAEENGEPPKGDLHGKTLLWGYTGCPTQNGDQKETTNCINPKKKGKVVLKKKHLDKDNDAAEWPVPKGAYYMCIQFYVNEPYKLYKCSKRIVVS